MTGTDLRELAARVAHDMPVDEVRDVLPGKLLEAADALDAAKARAVPEWAEFPKLRSEAVHPDTRAPLMEVRPNGRQCWVAIVADSGGIPRYIQGAGDGWQDAIAAAEAAKGATDVG